jgi:hypothetical protein
MWSLLAFTAVVGVAMYITFERIEGLLVAGGVLAILVYLLVGVRLTLWQDQEALGDLIEQTVAGIDKPLWAIVDGFQGTVLYLSEDGAAVFGHSREILTGQRFSDLTLEVSTAAKVVVAEMLRFGALGHPWSGVLSLKAEDGAVLEIPTEVLKLSTPESRQAGLVALGPVSGGVGGQVFGDVGGDGPSVGLVDT